MTDPLDQMRQLVFEAMRRHRPVPPLEFNIDGNPQLARLVAREINEHAAALSATAAIAPFDTHIAAMIGASAVGALIATIPDERTRKATLDVAVQRLIASYNQLTERRK